MKKQADNKERFGGKAAALYQLREGGFPVPPFFACEEGVPQNLDQLLKTLPGETFAVRSSAVGEDSGSHSFAGQYESYLFVRNEEVGAKIADVLASAESERVKAYREAGSVAKTSKTRVLVQMMVDAKESGVAFSADPVTNERGVVVISKVSGTAEKLVSGEVDGETFRIEGGRPPDGDLADVVDLVRRCEEFFGQPQDIEWCRDDSGKLWLVQSRPITTLAPIRRIWDNSNIAESYSGVTSPLTFSFASRVYAGVYRQFCRMMKVPGSRIRRHASVFEGLLEQINGHVYYDLLNWYRVLALLPGFSVNREFMEQMMGVKKALPAELAGEIVQESRRGKISDALALIRSVFGLIIQAGRIEKSKAAFYRRLNAALENEEIGDPVQSYLDLEEKLLKRWDAPLINDFLGMIAFGVLRKLCDKWTDGADPNPLVTGGDDIISLEPARRIREMAQLDAAGKSYDREWESYLQKFGDRCLEELKLESPTLRDESFTLKISVERLAERIRSGTIADSKEESPSPPKVKGFFRRRIFDWVLRQARNRIRDRENLRFERTRLFGRVRRIMVEQGRRLVEVGKLAQKEDVFFLTIEEILSGKGSVDLVEKRKREMQVYRDSESPPDRIESTTDFPEWDEEPDVEVDNDLSKKGTGCCPGIVEGNVRVVLDPRGVELESGEILVARQTDPGWVMLFPAASGLLVERGSLLSHSAIVSRELGLPSVVGLSGICSWLKTGDRIRMNGKTGLVEIVTKEGSGE